jgi:hypothetical protein
VRAVAESIPGKKIDRRNHPNITVKLVGEVGNAFAILWAARPLLRYGSTGDRRVPGGPGGSATTRLCGGAHNLFTPFTGMSNFCSMCAQGAFAILL